MITYTAKSQKEACACSSVGNNDQIAVVLGAMAPGLVDLGRGVYQGVSACGHMAMDGLRAIGPTVVAAGLL